MIILGLIILPIIMTADAMDEMLKVFFVLLFDKHGCCTFFIER